MYTLFGIITSCCPLQIDPDSSFPNTTVPISFKWGKGENEKITTRLREYGQNGVRFPYQELTRLCHVTGTLKQQFYTFQVKLHNCHYYVRVGSVPYIDQHKYKYTYLFSSVPYIYQQLAA